MRQYQRSPIVNTGQSLNSCSCNHQKTFSFIATLERYAINCRHEYWLAIGTVNKVGLLIISFFFPFKQAISKDNSPTMLPEWWCGSCFYARVN